MLKNDEVSYKSSLENSDMTTSTTGEGESQVTTTAKKSGLALTFKASAVQKTPFKTDDNTDVEAALAAFNQTSAVDGGYVTAEDIQSKIKILRATLTTTTLPSPSRA